MKVPDPCFENVCCCAYEMLSSNKMRILTMFITAVCFMFLLKLRWPKNKILYDKDFIACYFIGTNLAVFY